MPARLLGHHADNDVHPDLPAGPSDDAIAEKNATHHEEQHRLFRPMNGRTEEVAADDIREVEADAGDQQYAGEQPENSEERTHASQDIVDHCQARG